MALRLRTGRVRNLTPWDHTPPPLAASLFVGTAKVSTLFVDILFQYYAHTISITHVELPGGCPSRIRGGVELHPSINSNNIHVHASVEARSFLHL